MSATNTEMTAAEMLAVIEDLQARIMQACPELVPERVTDDGETYDALRCPTCGDLVDDSDSLYAVDLSQRWSRVETNPDLEVVNVFQGDTEYGDTLYYLHGEKHPVALPAGWTESWT